MEEAKKPASIEEYIDPRDDAYFERKYFQQDWAHVFPDHPWGESAFQRDPDGLYTKLEVRAAYAMWRMGKHGKISETAPPVDRPKNTPAEMFYISQRAGIYDEDGHLTHVYADYNTWVPDISEFRFMHNAHVCVVVQKGVNMRTKVETWAVRTPFGLCLALDGEWDDEPSPSNRTDEWLTQHRFTDAASAYAAGKKAYEEMLADYEAEQAAK